MNCEHCKELLPDFERAQLTPDQQVAVTAHLRGCATCAGAAAALRELNTLLDVEAQPSPALRPQVLALLEQDAARRKVAGTAVSFTSLFTTLWPSRPLGAFGYSLVLVVSGMFSGQLLPLGDGADVAEIPTERLVQLCAVPDPPPRDVL